VHVISYVRGLWSHFGHTVAELLTYSQKMKKMRLLIKELLTYNNCVCRKRITEMTPVFLYRYFAVY